MDSGGWMSFPWTELPNGCSNLIASKTSYGFLFVQTCGCNFCFFHVCIFTAEKPAVASKPAPKPKPKASSSVSSSSGGQPSSADWRSPGTTGDEYQNLPLNGGQVAQQGAYPDEVRGTSVCVKCKKINVLMFY